MCTNKILLTVFLNSVFCFSGYAASIALSGPTSVCPDQDYTYTASASNVFGSTKGSFDWTFYRNGQVIATFGNLPQCPSGPGSSSSTITYNWGSLLGITKIRVRFMGANDPLCHVTSPDEKWLDVNVRVFPPGIISGNLIFCSPGETHTLSIPGVPNIASNCFFHYKYDWIVPNGWSVVPTDGINYQDIPGGIRTFALSVRLTAPSTLQPGNNGNITVRTEPVWPYPKSNTAKIWVGPPEQAYNSEVYVQGFFGQDPITLAPEGLYFIQVENVPGATSYNWVLPAGFSFLSGYPTNSTLVKIWTSANPGTYQIRCYPQGPCGSSGTGYTGLTINIPGSGGNPCPEPPCQIPQPAIVLAPNPATTYFDISLDLSEEQLNTGYNVILYSNQKEVVFTCENNKEGSLRIETVNLKRGIYILSIITPTDEYTKRIFIK